MADTAEQAEHDNSGSAGTSAAPPAQDREAEHVEETPEGEALDEGEAVEVDPEVIARRDAALAYVRKFGDPVLREKARPVTVFDDRLASEIAWMGEIMHDGMGIGLAATQVGALRRLLVYRVQHEGPITALVNPEIEWHSREEEVSPEGCLSLPRVQVDVERPVHIRVRAQDPTGEAILVEASGLEARVIQHEMDHLDGILILKRTSRDERKEALASLREWQDQQSRG